MPYIPKMAGTTELIEPLDGQGKKRTGHRKLPVVNSFMGYHDKSCPSVRAMGIPKCTECPKGQCDWKAKHE